MDDWCAFFIRFSAEAMEELLRSRAWLMKRPPWLKFLLCSLSPDSPYEELLMFSIELLVMLCSLIIDFCSGFATDWLTVLKEADCCFYKSS